jgi:hypothetical protein
MLGMKIELDEHPSSRASHTMYVSRIYGCVVSSDVDLNLAPLDAAARPDLTLRQAHDEYDPGWKPEPTDLMSRYWSEAYQNGYLSARTTDGYRLRFDDYCEFDLNAGLDRAKWRVAPGAEPGLVPIVTAGALMTLKLMLGGDLVLHSSAVTVNGRGLAFVGRSGMGKSTMATLMCASGALAVTDDVGRVIFTQSGVRLAAGGHESRLRVSAKPIAGLLPDLDVRQTHDDRLALSLPPSALDTVPLDAIVVPCPSREAKEVHLRAISKPQAVILLSTFPRLSGMLDTTLIDNQFQMMADLVERVPVFTATIPWGASFNPETGPRLIRELGWGSP